MNSTATIFARLAGDATLTGQLATYTPKGGSVGPAIFNDFAPDDFEMGPGQPKPCLIIAAPVSDEPVETFTESARGITQDVRGYAYNGGSVAVLDGVMRRVRTLFHNAPGSLVVTGGAAKIARVSGPVGSPVSDPALIGRRVTLRLELQQS